jgi:putative IMPACT (imprinted ancient) family translation regulator
VVVTRWFGGIKLGAGGLVRAYGGCAAECLRQAPRVEVIPRIALHGEIPFDAVGSLYPVLEAFAVTRLAESYEEQGLVLEVAVEVPRRDAFLSALRDATRGRAFVREG